MISPAAAAEPVASPPIRSRILRDTLGYSASALLSQAVGLVAGFWIARRLGPADFGVWNAVSLLLVYGAYVDLGVLAAMGRDLPVHFGEGDQEAAARLESSARWATAAGAILVAVVVVAATYLPVFANRPPGLLHGLRLMTLVLILQQIYTYHRTVLRAHNKFGELSRQQMLTSFLTSGLAAALVTAFGLSGRLWAAVLAQAVIVGYALYRDPWRPLPAPSMATLWRLMRTGIPITLSGSILSLVTTVDRPMVLAFLGGKALGYFGLALLLTSMVSLVPGMAGQVLYPRITHRFGESGRDIRALRGFVLTPPLALARLLPIVIGPLYLMMPLVIGVFLPAYLPGLVATRIVLLGIFFYSVLGITDYFLVTMGKIAQFAVCATVGLVFNVAFDYLGLRLGYGIEGVAFTGTPLTYFVYSTIVIGYALSHYTTGLRDPLRYFFRLWWPFVYMVALLWMIEGPVSRAASAGGSTGLMVATGLRVVLYTVGMVPLAIGAARILQVDLSRASLARAWSGV